MCSKRQACPTRPLAPTQATPHAANRWHSRPSSRNRATSLDREARHGGAIIHARERRPRRRHARHSIQARNLAIQRAFARPCLLPAIIRAGSRAAVTAAMPLRSHLKKPSTPLRQRASPSSRTQRAVDRIVEATEALRDTPPEQQLVVAARNAPAPVAGPVQPPHRSKQPLPSILKRPRFHFKRRRLDTSAGEPVYDSEAIPQPKMRQGKKSVRLALPDRQESVRPSRSVSPASSATNKTSSGSSRKRRTTSHPRSQNRPAKRTKYTEPEFAAPGLSSAARKREVERPREMAKAKRQAEERQGRPSKGEASSSRLPRREKQAVRFPVERVSSRMRPSDLLRPGDGWARQMTFRTSVWYR